MFTKGQLISKANCQNEFVFTNMRRVFVHFLEEIEDTKKTFRNYLTFTMMITGPSSNQGHRSFYPTLHRNEVSKRLKVELSHALLEVLHTLFSFNLIMKVRLLVVTYCKEFN